MGNLAPNVTDTPIALIRFLGFLNLLLFFLHICRIWVLGILLGVFDVVVYVYKSSIT